jgi:hypothetical protein
VIAGAALAGAITGGAIPFLFAARKSGGKSQASFDETGGDFDSGESRPALFSKFGSKRR